MRAAQTQDIERDLIIENYRDQQPNQTANEYVKENIGPAFGSKEQKCGYAEEYRCGVSEASDEEKGTKLLRQIERRTMHLVCSKEDHRRH